MKNLIRNEFSRAGILPAIDLIRRLPEIVSWLRRGCTGIAPAPVKRMVITAYMRAYDILEFVETGTHIGDTLAFIARDKRVHATSIELDEGYFRAAEERFATYSNVTLLHGDSAELLPPLMHSIRRPTLFWLDGHYSGDGTGRGDLVTPICAELESILDSQVKGHVVLIDDARLFDGSDDYPHLDKVLERIRSKGAFNAEVSADIIRLTPTRPNAAC